jgi:hypothetical protein
MTNISTEFGSVENRSFFAGTEIAALTSSVTLAAGQGVLRKGAVLGKVTADGKYKLVDKAATDGSEKASVVLATETVDTTGGDQEVVVYTQGIFNYDALYVAAGDTVKAHEEELRLGNIYFKTDF